MSSGARVARAGLLSLLAVGWALAGHLLAMPTHGPAAAGLGVTVLAGTVLGPLLWAGLAVGLIGWLVLPTRRSTGPGQQTRRAFVLGGVLGLGQLLTHAALALAPLLAGQVRPVGHVHLHGHVQGQLHAAVGTAATDAPQTEVLIGAVAHGGSTMLLAHGLATIAAALAWTLASVAWETVAGWLGRVTVRLAPVAVLLRPPPAAPACAPRALAPHHSWEGRGPPSTALATGAAPPRPALSVRLV